MTTKEFKEILLDTIKVKDYKYKIDNNRETAEKFASEFIKIKNSY